ncbi:MAG TPA: ParB/RepB/Spo0J family partition protein [Candidatus Aquabacterium excrementipullorum]|nr:ParB/RepB/Spo0J family partition protein [Candidatus Aquabacterium excrementipullorum]
MASSPHRGTTMPFSALPIPDLLAEASPAPDELLDSDVETVLDLDLSVDAAQATAAAPVLPEEPSSLPPPSAPPTLCLADPSIVFLDPHLLRFSADYNRDEASFDTPDFKELCRSVAAHGGNLQPICVVERVDEQGQTYHEVVFGELRVRACRQVEVKVRAMVMQSRSCLDNALLRLGENRGRKDLAPLEFGRQVKRVLDDPSSGLNRTQLAKILGCHPGHVGRGYELASLPAGILDAFDAPLELQFAHMLPLKQGYAAQPTVMLQEAERIREELEPLSTKGVIERLLKAVQAAEAKVKEGAAGEVGVESGLASSKPIEALQPPRPIQTQGREIGRWDVLPSGAITLVIEAPMSDHQRHELVEALVRQLEHKVFKTTTSKKPVGKAKAAEDQSGAAVGERS